MYLVSESPQSLDDLEVRIFADPSDGYIAEARSSDDKASCALPPPPLSELDEAAGPKAYGTVLFRWLFQQDVGDLFRRARWATDSYSRTAGPVGGLRVRLWLDPRSDVLHRLRWEALYDSDRDQPLVLDVVLSRFLRSRVALTRPISESPLRILLVACNPHHLEALDLAEIDEALDRLGSGGAMQQIASVLEVGRLLEAPLDDVRSHLSTGFHVLHLWAETTFAGEAGSLILCGDKDEPVTVPFAEVPRTLVGDGPAPHLVFVATASPEADPGGERLSPLASAWIEAGAQAVVTIGSPLPGRDQLFFTEKFYGFLLRSGTIDAAMAEARSRIYQPDPDRWSWAAPVLYMRTAEGQLFQPLPEDVGSIVQSPLFKRLTTEGA
jgi:hypothetical protein